MPHSSIGESKRTNWLPTAPSIFSDIFLSDPEPTGDEDIEPVGETFLADFHYIPV